MKRTRPNRSHTSRGFTVIELIVAAGITVVLAGLMIVVVSNVLAGWNRTHGTLTSEGSARLVLDQLEKDLGTVMARRDGHVWLAVTAKDDTSNIKNWTDERNAKPLSLDLTATRSELSAEDQNGIANARFGKAGTWLRFIVSGPSAPVATGVNAFNGPVAVSYQIVRRLPTNAGAGTSTAASHYLLFRTEIDPAATFSGGYDFDPASTAPPTYMTALETPRSDDIMADNVIDLGVWFYARAPDGTLTRIFPDGTGNNYVGFPDTRGRFPAVADIMVRILTPDGALRIANYEAGHGEGDWWMMAEAGSRVYIRRVQLATNPL